MNRTRRRRAIILTTLGVLLLAVGLSLGAVVLAPVIEKMKLEGSEVEIKYTPNVGAEELLLPFYPGAKVEDSFIYYVYNKTDGKQVLLYGYARLTIEDSPEKAIGFYREKLTSHLEGAKLEEVEGERWVLAVANESEVRRVTVAAAQRKTVVELVRTTRPAPPSPTKPPLQPRRREQIG